MVDLRRAATAVLVLLFAVAVGACSGGATASPGSSILPGPSISPGGTLTTGDLRLILVDTFGPRWYCDPDYYPLARPSFEEGQAAIERFPEIQADAASFGAIVRHLGYLGTTFSDAQKLEIYRLWKVVASISLEPAANGAYRFDYLAQPPADGQDGTETTGTIAADGTIRTEATATAGAPNCPICLARGSAIDTPTGAVPVDRLRLGATIWTLDPAGRRVTATVIALGSTRAPANHRVIHLALADGRSVIASPGHPLADGRHIGSLRLGDVVDGSRVVGVTSEPYGGGETFDLLVSGPTGIYLSDGIPLGSTLR
jgi:hypothetical protein